MCSRVDLPEPEGPTSATISPGRTWRSARLITSRKPLPAWRKRCWTFRNSSAGSLIAQRLDRIEPALELRDRKSTRLNSSHSQISYAVFCLKKKKLLALREREEQE